MLLNNVISLCFVKFPPHGFGSTHILYWPGFCLIFLPLVKLLWILPNFFNLYFIFLPFLLFDHSYFSSSLFRLFRYSRVTYNFFDVSFGSEITTQLSFSSTLNLCNTVSFRYPPLIGFPKMRTKRRICELLDPGLKRQFVPRNYIIAHQTKYLANKHKNVD